MQAEESSIEVVADPLGLQLLYQLKAGLLPRLLRELVIVQSRPILGQKANALWSAGAKVLKTLALGLQISASRRTKSS